MTEDKEQNQKPADENSGVLIEGHIKIFDPQSEEVFVDKRNAIHYENFSEALAKSIANRSDGYIEEMHFGNGGTSVDSTGVITYLTPNNSGSNAGLYNETYFKYNPRRINYRQKNKFSSDSPFNVLNQINFD